MSMEGVLINAKQRKMMSMFLLKNSFIMLCICYISHVKEHFQLSFVTGGEMISLIKFSKHIHRPHYEAQKY
jgi:hypothetical protein